MKNTKQSHFRHSLFTDLYVSFVSRTQSQDSQAYGPLPHQISLFVTFSGSGTLQVQNHSFRLKSEQGLLIPAGMSLNCRPDPGQPWDWARIGFNGNRTAQVLSSVGIRDLASPYLLYCCSSMEEPVNCLLFGSDSLEQELACQSAACRILSALAENTTRNLGDGSRSGQNPYVSKAMEYIAYHYQEPVSVQDLSQLLGITRNYLFTLFKEELRCSPSRYLTDFRLKKAAVLLRQTEYSIEDIALSCGYQEPTVFSRAFHRQYGQSPAAYRKNGRNDSRT